MTLADLAALGGFVSGLAVLVSLVLLYFQLRQVGKQITQAEKNQRALMIQGANKRSIDENIWLSEPHIVASLIKAIDCAGGLTSQDILQLSAIVRNMLLSFQDTYIQHKAGLADETTLEHTVGGLRFFFSIPAMRVLYTMSHATFAPSLTALTDDMIAEVPLRTSHFAPEAFRAQLAALLRTHPA
jgi:hypothetical protein